MSARKRPMWRKKGQNYVYTPDRWWNRYQRRIKGWGDQPCPCAYPDGSCICSNGIGCVNVPLDEW